MAAIGELQDMMEAAKVLHLQQDAEFTPVEFQQPFVLKRLSKSLYLYFIIIDTGDKRISVPRKINC